MARNAGEARFSRFETNVVSFTVGNVQKLIDFYLHLQHIHDADPATPLPVGALDLRRWEESYRFASKVPDPSGFTPFGYARLGNRVCSLVEDSLVAMGHPLVQKTGPIRRLRWLRNL